jgi:uncharacterized protein YecA (UPF0149 family)
MQNKNVIVSGYKVTTSNEVINKLYGVTPDIEQKLYEMSVKVQKGKNSAIKELNDLIYRYPQIPMFKNFLSTLYDMKGNHFMAKEVNDRLIKANPDYLYGKLNAANIAIVDRDFEKVPTLLGESFDLKMICPERDVFHYGEVVGFLQTTFNYYIGIEDLEQAQIILDILKEYNKVFEIGLNVFDFERKIMGLNHKRREQERASGRTPDVIAKQIVKSTTKAPQFVHPIIKQLYCNDLSIDQQIISEILALPRETLLADLHKVVYDSMARFSVFMDDMDWDNDTHEFLMHALLLLTELKDESSVEVILDVLRQDEDYQEVWFNDFLCDGFWEFLYTIANDKLDQLYNYIIEPNGYTYSKTTVSQMIQQIVFHQPERRLEVVAWYKRVFEFWIANKDNNDIIDTDVIALSICDIANIQLVELTTEMQTLFNHKLVSIAIAGSLEDCMENMNGLTILDREHKVFRTIQERYTDYTSTWLNDDYKEEQTRNEFYEEMKKIVPLPIAKPVIGRNDLCMCGSGKKYKKCCGK